MSGVDGDLFSGIGTLSGGEVTRLVRDRTIVRGRANILSQI